MDKNAVSATRVDMLYIQYDTNNITGTFVVFCVYLTTLLPWDNDEM